MALLFQTLALLVYIARWTFNLVVQDAREASNAKGLKTERCRWALSCWVEQMFEGELSFDILHCIDSMLMHLILGRSGYVTVKDALFTRG